VAASGLAAARNAACFDECRSSHVLQDFTMSAVVRRPVSDSLAIVRGGDATAQSNACAQLAGFIIEWPRAVLVPVRLRCDLIAELPGDIERLASSALAGSDIAARSI